MPDRIILSGSQVISQSPLGNLRPGYVAIFGNRIESLGLMEELHTRPGDLVFDLAGKSVLPGLIDSHTHLISESSTNVTDDLIARGTIAGVLAASATLQGGITTVRDLGCKHLGIFVLKEAVQSGRLSGPRMLTAGRNISGTGVPEAWRNYAFDGPDEIQNAVNCEWQAGADWIKLIVSIPKKGSDGLGCDIPLLSQAEMDAAVEEAHLRGLRVCCHADGDIGARLAVASHTDSIEHGISLADDLIDEMAEKGIFYVPTAWCYGTDPPPAWRADYSVFNESHRRGFQRALSAGVKIAAGTDVDNRKCLPLDALVNELVTMVAWGMSEAQALEASTVRGAELLGLETQLGTLAPGKVADLIVVDGDPLADITALRQVVLVIQEGQVVFSKQEGPGQMKPVPLSVLQPSSRAQADNP